MGDIQPHLSPDGKRDEVNDKFTKKWSIAGAMISITFFKIDPGMKSIGEDFSFKFEIDLYTSDRLTGLNEVIPAPSILSRDSTDLMAVVKGLDESRATEMFSLMLTNLFVKN